MNRAIAALPLLLAACAPVGPPVSSRSVQSASFEMRTWGNLMHRWTLDSAGRVEHVRDATPFGGKKDPGYQLRRTTLTAAQRTALAAALEKVERVRARPQACAQQITDGPYGKFEWVSGASHVAFDWNLNCMDGRDAELSTAIGAADKIVDDAALATPVLQTLPEEGGGKGS